MIFYQKSITVRERIDCCPVSFNMRSETYEEDISDFDRDIWWLGSSPKQSR